MRAISFLLVFSGFVGSYAQPQWEWLRQFTSSKWVMPVSMDLGQNDKIFVAGHFGGFELELEGQTVLRLNPEYHPVITKGYVMALQQNGNVSWATAIRGNRPVWMKHVTVGPSGELWATGSSAADTLFFSGPEKTALPLPGTVSNFLVHYGPSGAFRWAFVEDRSHGQFDMTALQADHDGNLYIGGRIKNTASLPDTVMETQGRFEAVLLKLDPSGSLEWAKSSDGGAVVGDLEVDASGNVYLAGQVTGNYVRFDSTQVLNKSLVSLFPSAADGFITKYLPDGTVDWVVSAHGIGDESMEALALRPDGNLSVHGGFNSISLDLDSLFVFSDGRNRVFSATISPEGQIQDMFAFTGNLFEMEAAFPIGSGGLHLAGQYADPMVIGGDSVRLASAGVNGVIMGFQPDGNLAWDTRIPGDLVQVLDMVPGPDGSLLISVHVSDTVLDLGSFHLEHAPKYNISFIGKLSGINTGFASPASDRPLVRVHPNPVKNQLLVSSYEENIERESKVKILDLSGRVLVSRSLMGTSGVIPTQYLPSGIYLLQIQTDKGMFAKKIVKE